MCEKGPNPVFFLRLIPRLRHWIMIRLFFVAPGAEFQPGMLEGVKFGLRMEGLEEELDLMGY